MDIEPTRWFRLAARQVACDADGLRIGDLPLLARDARGGWAMRPASDLNPALASVYGFPVDIAAKRCGLSAVARGLNDGDLARAQVTALFLHLPDPPDPGRAIEKRWLASALAACGLLKADPDWDAKHPRTGTAPNPGWFATTAGVVGSLMARDLSPAALRALETMATRFKVATTVFDTLFVPSANPVVEQGAVPGRPDMSYTWAHDETRVLFNVLIDGQWRTLVQGERGADNLVRDAEGNVVARIVGSARGETLVADLGALDRAARTRRRSRKRRHRQIPLRTRNMSASCHMGWPSRSEVSFSMAAIRRRGICWRRRQILVSCSIQATRCTAGSNRKIIRSFK